MQPKYRLYQRSNRASGTFYAEDSVTRARTTLGTKDRAEAEKLLQAKNESHAQPTLSRELAKVYLQAQDPQFGTRTWADVAGLIDAAYEGSTKDRFEKFMRSAPVRGLMNRRLAETCSTDFLAVFAHPRAGMSTNVQLRILHNRALDLEWILRPVLSKRAWPKVKYGFRKGITREQHETLLAATPSQEYRLFFELLWGTGGSQTDIAMLQADDIHWPMRRLYYSRQKLQSKGKGNACLVIGPALEAILRHLPTEGPLFPPTQHVGRKAARQLLLEEARDCGSAGGAGVAFLPLCLGRARPSLKPIVRRASTCQFQSDRPPLMDCD